jgi:hypothetical protein
VSIDTGRGSQKAPASGSAQEALASAPENEDEDEGTPAAPANPWAAIGLSSGPTETEEVESALQILEPTVVASLRTSSDLLKAITRELITTMVRDGAGAAKATASLREFLESAIIDRIASALRVPDARMRVTLATSYRLGVAGSRYVLRLEPLASASEDDVVRMVAPAVQAALSGSRASFRSGLRT